MSTTPSPGELMRLRTELLQQRASLFDPETGLPALPAMVDSVRRMLDDRESVQVLLVRVEQEHDLERLLGWERYDGMLRRLADLLRSAAMDGAGQRHLLCQECVRGDTFLLFVNDHQEASRIASVLQVGLWLQDEDRGEPTRLALRTGRGVIHRQLAQRLERCIHRGVLDARLDFHRRGEALDAVRRGELERLLRDRAVTILFQPILRQADGFCVGHEALARGPAGTYLEPAENLFGFAQRAGLLGEVELLCLGRSLEAAARLPGRATVFVNMSIDGLEFLQSHAGGLRRAVERGGWQPDRFVLEITERTCAENPEQLKASISDLRRAGFRIAIDDMGTGYSSLHLLAELEPDFIKLDQMLVRNLSHEPIKQNLVSAIAGFAATSRAAVIAEGVETAAEAEILEALGVHLVQGFYFALPRAL